MHQELMRSEEVDDVRYFGIDEMELTLAKSPELFVPHHEAYQKLFEYSAALSE